MTIIRTVSDSHSEASAFFGPSDALTSQFAPVFEVFWQLAKEEHPEWSFDHRVMWARTMTERVALGDTQVNIF